MDFFRIILFTCFHLLPTKLRYAVIILPSVSLAVLTADSASNPRRGNKRDADRPPKSGRQTRNNDRNGERPERDNHRSSGSGGRQRYHPDDSPEEEEEEEEEQREKAPPPRSRRGGDRARGGGGGNGGGAKDRRRRDSSGGAEDESPEPPSRGLGDKKEKVSSLISCVAMSVKSACRVRGP